MALDVRLDATVLVFTALAAIGAGVLFGLAPAWQISRPPYDSLKEGDALARRHSGRIGCAGPVMGEVALALVLLVGTGLFCAAWGWPSHYGSGRQGSEPVIIIDETRAKQYWPNEDALGKHMRRALKRHGHACELSRAAPVCGDVVGLLRHNGVADAVFGLYGVISYSPFERTTLKIAPGHLAYVTPGSCASPPG